jgi:hypothetical protein
MNYSFAVLFVVVTTMATAGVWAVVQWLSDVYLGTGFILTGESESVVERALMLNFVAATVAGVLAGVVFELYFRRYADASARLPTAAARAGEGSDGGAVGEESADGRDVSTANETAGDREEVRRT